MTFVHKIKFIFFMFIFLPLYFSHKDSTVWARFFSPGDQSQLSSSPSSLSLTNWLPLMKEQVLMKEIKLLEELPPEAFINQAESYWDKFSVIFEERLSVCALLKKQQQLPMFKHCENDLKQFEEAFLHSHLQARYRYLLWIQEQEKNQFKQLVMPYGKVKEE
jgi:hypothetical protein